jgi:hypothetical protein
MYVQLWTSALLTRMMVVVRVLGDCKSMSQFLLFTSKKCTQYVKYIYLSPMTSYTFRCWLHHLQGDHYIICSRTTRFFSVLQYCCISFEQFIFGVPVVVN